jgi:hypothetical protein
MFFCSCGNALPQRNACKGANSIVHKNYSVYSRSIHRPMLKRFDHGVLSLICTFKHLNTRVINTVHTQPHMPLVNVTPHAN